MTNDDNDNETPGTNQQPYSLVLMDDRPICSGPRRRRQRHDNSPYRSDGQHRPTYAIHLGIDTQYGQLNNKIIQLFHAVDNAMDSGGNSVVVISRWAYEWMSPFFPDPNSWEQLEHDFPIVRDTSVAQQQLQSLNIRTSDLLNRKKQNLVSTNSWEVVQERRLRFLHYLFSSLDGEPCHFWQQVQGFLEGRTADKSDKYVAVHVRNMDGMCESFNHGNPYGKEQCSMSPAYIKSVLEAAGVYGKYPIVVLSDMHDTEKLHTIQNELDNVIIPQWDLNASPSMIADLVMGTMSEVFIGEQTSSGSRNIALLREAFGKDPATNYVYMDKTEDGKWSSFTPRYPYEWGAGVEQK